MNREIGDIYVPRAVPVGTKIWFSSERHGYTVRTSNTAFAILTKPFNAQKNSTVHNYRLETWYTWS